MKTIVSTIPKSSTSILHQSIVASSYAPTQPLLSPHSAPCTVAIITAHAPGLHMWPSRGPLSHSKYSKTVEVGC